MPAYSLMICLVNLLSISNSYSQSTSPQNIETFYPFSPPSNKIPPPPPDRSTIPPPTAAVPPPSPPRNSSTKVGTAIGVTAASTVVFSVLLFFLLTKYNSRRKREESVASGVGAAVPRNDGFTRYGGVKGLIVDESGLDVLYWKNLQEGEKRHSFKKRYYESLREEEKRIVSEGERKSKPPAQETPLLDGKSSSSQSPSWAGRDDQIIKKEPLFSNHVNVKNVAPPVPPPPGVSPPQPSLIEKTPAPPPPPKVAVGAVPNGKRAAPPPPPPPPVPAKKGPAPPPPPPPASAGESSSEKVKFKPLHWDKVNPNLEHSMVWDKIEKGSFKFDGDLMEALFGSVVTNRNSPPIPTTNASAPPSPIFILDPRKSQNTAIVLKSLTISRREIIEALNEGRTLNTDSIEKLARIAPTDEESSQIIAFNGDPTRLADAESFLFHLLRSIPTAFKRFNAMLFRSNYDLEVSSIKKSLQSIDSACNELRNRGLFLKLLEAVLKAGNRLNAGTERGNAQAFNLTALRKLSDVKSSDGKTTLLQFVVQEVVRAEGKRCVLNRNRSLSRTSNRSRKGAVQTSDNSKDEREREYMMLGLPTIGGISAEFSNVKKSATFDYDDLNKSISELTAQVIEIRNILRQCSGRGSGGGFVREIETFLDAAELEIKLVKEEQIRVMELVKKTTDYYQATSHKDKGANPFQLFVIVGDFLGMVDTVCIEISRNVQKRKSAPSVAGSSSPESARVFMFPKLPANFMLDNSKSSSSDSDSDSEVQ